MTLIEVMAGLAILGTVLVCLVIARGRWLRQWALAGRKQQAVTVADALLSQWWENRTEFRRHATGELVQQGMRWKTSVRKNPAAKQVFGEVVRLEIYDQADVAKDENRVLAQIDVLLNLPETDSLKNTSNTKMR